MTLGIVDTIGLATTVVFALPVANYGLMRILAGETVFGVAMIVVAVAMVVIPHVFFDPGRILRGLLSGILPGSIGRTDSEPTDPTEK